MEKRLIFVEDGMDSEIFFDTPADDTQSATKKSGEYRLMFAVLEDALTIYQNYHLYAQDHVYRRRQFLEVEAWVASRDNFLPFSFESLCAVFDMNANRIRKELSRRHVQRSSVVVAKHSNRASSPPWILGRRMRPGRHR